MNSKKSHIKKNISAAILAGGEGCRMGNIDKSCVKISGEKLVSKVIKSLSGLFTETFIITRTPENHKELNVRLAGDIYKCQSSLTGIHSALVHSKTDLVFITACDSPFISRNLIIELLSQLSVDDDVLIPFHPNGHYEPLCAIYSQKCIPHIEKKLNDNIFRIVSFFPHVKVKTVDVQILCRQDKNLETFINVNTPEELAKVRELIKNGK